LAISDLKIDVVKISAGPSPLGRKRSATETLLMRFVTSQGGENKICVWQGKKADPAPYQSNLPSARGLLLSILAASFVGLTEFFFD
jgi:hypothetical protein